MQLYFIFVLKCATLKQVGKQSNAVCSFALHPQAHGLDCAILNTSPFIAESELVGKLFSAETVALEVHRSL
jgi:hypothetical protein